MSVLNLTKALKPPDWRDGMAVSSTGALSEDQAVLGS